MAVTIDVDPFSIALLLATKVENFSAIQPAILFLRLLEDALIEIDVVPSA